MNASAPLIELLPRELGFDTGTPTERAAAVAAVESGRVLSLSRHSPLRSKPGERPLLIGRPGWTRSAKNIKLRFADGL